jgi:hypothetical protein
MPHLNSLLQFIVPLTFLAIWALTSLFNREAQPLPPRTGRAPIPPGPRPGGGFSTAPQPADLRPEAAGRDPNVRWGNANGRRTPGRLDDGIVILESETRRTPTNPSVRSVSAPPKRSARPKPAVVPPERPEPPTHHILHSTTGLPHQMGHPLDVHLQGSTHTPLLRASQDLARTQPPVNEVPQALTRPESISFDVRAALVSPSKLREAFILNEIIQPPIAARRSRPRA